MTVRPLAACIAVCCLLLHPWELHPADLYASNSLGQKLERLSESDTYDPALMQGYILESSHVRDTLYLQDAVIWVEERYDSRGYSFVERKDPEGQLIVMRRYRNSFLLEEMQRLPDGTLYVDYTYGDDLHLLQAESRWEDDLTHVHFTTDSHGRASSIIVLDDDQHIERALYLKPETSVFGDEKDYTLVARNEEFESVSEFEDNRIVFLKKTYQERDGAYVTETVDYVDGVLRVLTYAADTDLLLSEETSQEGTNQYILTEYTYDQEERVIEQRITEDEVTSVYHTEYHGDGIRTVRYTENEIPVKTTHYLEEGRIEDIFVDGILFASITYDESGTVLQVEHAR